MAVAVVGPNTPKRVFRDGDEAVKWLNRCQHHIREDIRDPDAKLVVLEADGPDQPAEEVDAEGRAI